MWKLIQLVIIAAFVAFGVWHASQLDPGGESTKRGAIVIWAAGGTILAFLVTYAASKLIDRCRAKLGVERPRIEAESSD